MPVADDLKTHATSTLNFYDLLSLPATFTQKELDRAYRRTALKYHPDKAGSSNVQAQEKFHLVSIAHELLSDATLRALYDNTRAAREQTKRKREQLDGERRLMRENLEARERGVKRGREELDDEERTLRRLQEEGKKKIAEMRERKQKEAMRAVEAQEEEERRKRDAGAKSAPAVQVDTAQKEAADDDIGLSRSVKVRFLREAVGDGLGIAQLREMFSIFGAVEHSFFLKDKRTKIRGEKRMVGTGMVIFKENEGARVAAEDWEKMKSVTGNLWTAFEDVFRPGAKDVPTTTA